MSQDMQTEKHRLKSSGSLSCGEMSSLRLHLADNSFNSDDLFHFRKREQSRFIQVTISKKRAGKEPIKVAGIGFQHFPALIL